MELLIPGLILVALMVYASTRIKKRAAEAFEPESIETENYALKKPDGFLHVLNSDAHDFEAYSKDFAEDYDGVRRGTIEIDILPGTDLETACDELRKMGDEGRTIRQTESECVIEIKETANEFPVTALYKLVNAGENIYRLRFAVLEKHASGYMRTIDETLDSFTIRSH